MPWKPIDKQVYDDFITKLHRIDNVVLFLKCLSLKHVFLLSVHIRDRKISRVDIVDTSPVVIDNDTLLKRLKYILKLDVDPMAQIKIPLNEYAKEHQLRYESDIINLQTAERQVTSRGYCNGWLLFFIFSRVNGMSFSETYSKLLASGNPVNTTITIISWWMDMFNRALKLL
jgi:hypothetical protein